MNNLKKSNIGFFSQMLQQELFFYTDDLQLTEIVTAQDSIYLELN